MFCGRGGAGGRKNPALADGAQPFTFLWRWISPILPITSLRRIRPIAPARAKMGQMSDRRELRVLGSFRNFAHRQDAVGSFRKSLPSALQSAVYEISKIGQAVSPSLRFRSGCGRASARSFQSGL